MIPTINTPGLAASIAMTLTLFSGLIPTHASAEEVGTVTIHRDTFGVPYIYGGSDADAAYGLGYAQGRGPAGRHLPQRPHRRRPHVRSPGQGLH